MAARSVSKLLDKVEAFLDKNNIYYEVDGDKENRVITIGTDEGDLTVVASEDDDSCVTFSCDILCEDADAESLKETMTEIFRYLGFTIL